MEWFGEFWCGKECNGMFWQERFVEQRLVEVVMGRVSSGRNGIARSC